MAFCMECGTRLPDGAKFCPVCGTRVANSPIPNEGPEKKTINMTQEKVVKCPNCSSLISRLDAVCPYCGAQISGREASTSIQRFAQQLYEVEQEPSEPEGGLMGLLGYSKAMEQAYGSKAFERKISLISSFPIPNTIEEISEFVVLAANSIDEKWGKNTMRNRMFGKPGTAYYTNIKLADTWINKLNQAYTKAKISFRSDPMFSTIEKIYIDKMKELNRPIEN